MKVFAISHSCVTDVNQELYIALNKIPGVEVEIVVPANWKSEYTGQRMLPSFLPGISFQTHSLPVAIPGHNSLHFYKWGLGHLMRRSCPDVIFVDEEPWSLAVLQAIRARRKRTPFVCYTKQNIFKPYPAPFSWIEQRTYHEAAALIALSEEVRDVLRRKGFQGPCPLLAHGCDLSLFRPGRSESLRQKLGLEGTVVGFLGRFVKEKGLDTVMEALARVVSLQPDQPISVLMIGSGPEEVSLKQAAANLGKRVKCIFPGTVPHMDAGEYLRCMDIFVLPSRTTPTWKEQFGRVIIEALACGVPVVGSDSGQIPILLRETGGGLVFKEGNAEDLAAQLLLLINDPAMRHRLGETGKEAVQRSFTYEAVAQQLHDVLQGAVESQRVRAVTAV